MFEAALVVPAAMAVGDFARSSRNVSERGTSARWSFKSAGDSRRHPP
jgi:hypothetical protein